ncbi:hypothetical protein [Amycolatopsis sp. NPDC051061]
MVSGRGSAGGDSTDRGAAARLGAGAGAAADPAGTGSGADTCRGLGEVSR